MQTYDEYQNNALVSFTRSLLSHRANDVKTPLLDVEAKYQEYNKTKLQANADETYLQQQYDEMHGQPRIQARAAYEQFLEAKLAKRRVFKHTGKYDDMRDWLHEEFPQDFWGGYMDTQYTKYVYEM